MAKEETCVVGGVVAYAAVIAILIILLAVVALVVVNALKDSPWGTFTIAMTIPIALLMGIYLRRIRPGKVLEVSALGGWSILTFHILTVSSTAESCEQIKGPTRTSSGMFSIS